MLARLDAELLALIEPLDIPEDELKRALDYALEGSLWGRGLEHLDERGRAIQRVILEGRAGFIWRRSTSVQRRGFFFAGLGFETGRLLDDNAELLEAALVRADNSAAVGDVDELVRSVLEFAEVIFRIPIFCPQGGLPPLWREMTEAWLAGDDIQSIHDLVGEWNDGTDPMRFIEDGLIYRLVWGIEVVRVHGTAKGTFVSQTPGAAAAAIETGTPSLAASLMIRAGLSSRVTAVAAAYAADLNFCDYRGLRDWMLSNDMYYLNQIGNWPTPATASFWREFVREFGSSHVEPWTIRESVLPVEWFALWNKPVQKPRRIVEDEESGEVYVCDEELTRLGRLTMSWDGDRYKMARIIDLPTEDTIKVRFIDTKPQATH